MPKLQQRYSALHRALTLEGISFKSLLRKFKPMAYAVVKTGGKQYRVAPGDIVRVERLSGQVGDQVTLGEVLMVGGNGEVKIGTPTLPDVKVTAEIVDQGLAKKIIVFKKKRRKSYSRKRGHRQKLTTLKIVQIQG